MGVVGVDVVGVGVVECGEYGSRGYGVSKSDGSGGVRC